MHDFDAHWRDCLRLPPADPAFAARVQARIAARHWPQPGTAMSAVATPVVWLQVLNLFGGAVLAGLALYGLDALLPSAGWWWTGLCGGIAAGSWSLFGKPAAPGILRS